MVDIIKQDMTDLWAISGDVVAPDPAKVREGWAVEVVPRQWWNWMQYRADSNIAYMLQKGVPEWDAFTEYLANKSFVSSAGIVYKCLVTNTNLPPASNPTQWARAFADYSVASNALGSLTPAANAIPYFTSASAASTFPSTAYGRGVSNLANIAAALTYFGAQAVNTNLTALSGVVAATNVLPYFNGTTSMAGTTLTAFGRSLIDDNDAVAARSTLGLGTAAIANLTTSSTDNTAGRVLQVGDFGLGAEALSDIDPNTIGTSRFFRAFNSPNMPTLGTWAGLHINREAGGRAVQMAWEDATGRAYQRIRSSGGVWGGWVEHWTGQNLIKTTHPIDNTAGRMLQVGDFGLGSTNTVILTSLDDTSTPVGFYATNDTTVGTPAGFALGMVTITRWPSLGNIVQEFTVVGNSGANRKFFRSYNVSTSLWNGWAEVYHAALATQIRSDLGLNAAATAPVTGTGNAVMSVSPALTGVPTAPTATLGTNTTQIATTQFVLANSTSNPSGTILAYAGSVVPAGYLLANGSVVNRTTYADLFAAIGTTYGAGDGSTTFSIPDLRGEFLRGLDNGRGVDSSRTLGSFQNSQFASHSHTFTGNAYGGHDHTGGTSNVYHDHTLTGAWADSQGNHAHNVGLSTSSGGGASSADGNGVAPTANLVTDYQGTHTHNVYGSTTGHNHTHSFTTNWGGAFTPTGSISLNGGTTNGSETRPRNVAVQFLIKF